MSKTLPKTLFGPDRSSFALINPQTELYYRKLDHSLRQHVAISYVWSEWKHSPSDKLPAWTLIRERLLSVLGPDTSGTIRSETGNASCCWLDSKCIDQDSAKSKSHWIPRMDQIYAEAKCTVLLLREVSLEVLVPLAQGLRCKVKSKASMFDWPHSCLQSQTCTPLPDISTDQEKACIQALKRLYDGAWRKRAWIFQEILLSRKYIISLQGGNAIEIGDIGVIANLLFQRHPNETWLGHFSDWCRRLFYLRHFYNESEFHHLSEANVLQMAMGLEASVAADKVYALCGILRLKSVVYNNQHSADEAFQVVVGELVKRGRLAWLYAIPPPLDEGPMHLSQSGVTPFVLTRMDDTLVGNRNKMNLSQTWVGVPVVHIGRVIETKPLAEMLERASNWIREHDSLDLPTDLEYLFFIPKIVRRIALDVVNPLLMDPLFSQICHGLNISPESGSRPTRVWKMIMALCTKDVTSAARSVGDSNEVSDIGLADSAARSLQDRLQLVRDEFVGIWWCSYDDNRKITLGLGSRTCRPGIQICSVKGDKNLLLAVSFAARKGKSAGAYFRGMIYSLDTVMTIQYRVKVLGLNFVFQPLDIPRPVVGDHSFNDGFKDSRFDKYIKTDMQKGGLLSLLGISGSQKGRGIYVKLLYR